MGNCAAKKRAQRLRAAMEHQAALERAGLAGSAAGAEDVQGAGSDAAGAFSGYGGGYGGYGYVHEEECPEGIDEDLALLLTAAAIAAGAFVVFREITQRQGRRKKRNDEDDSGLGGFYDGFTASVLLGKVL